MARFSSRTVFVFTLPAVIGFLSFIWLRRKKKGSSQHSRYETGKIITSLDTGSVGKVREDILTTTTVKLVATSKESDPPIETMQLKGSQSSSIGNAGERRPPCRQNSTKTAGGAMPELTDGTSEVVTGETDSDHLSEQGDGQLMGGSGSDGVLKVLDGLTSLRVSVAADIGFCPDANGKTLIEQGHTVQAKSVNTCDLLGSGDNATLLCPAELAMDVNEKNEVREEVEECPFEKQDLLDKERPDGDCSDAITMKGQLESSKESCNKTLKLPPSNPSFSGFCKNGAVQKSSEDGCKRGFIELQECTDAAANDIKDATLPEDNVGGPVLSTSSGDDPADSPSYSNYSDVHSEGSSDSGKGGSDIQGSVDTLQTAVADDTRTVYEFELPQQLCGRLIGKYGKNVNYIKNCSNATIFIKRHPFNQSMKLCVVEGLQSEVTNALELIRRKFPLSQFPTVSLEQFNVPLTCGIPLPESLQLHLPEGVSCDVILSSLITAGHFFLQQPTHPSYPSLSRLDQYMVNCYSQMNTPTLPKPVEMGIICAAPMCEGWFRVQVIYVHEENEECDVKFVDYGGFSRLPLNSLRQIRSDFMTLPFQGVECYLGQVKSIDEGGTWSPEACTLFEELAQGQILQALIVGYADDSVPYVHLYRIQGVSTIFINRELVNRGYATWTDHQQ